MVSNSTKTTAGIFIAVSIAVLVLVGVPAYGEDEKTFITPRQSVEIEAVNGLEIKASSESAIIIFINFVDTEGEPGDGVLQRHERDVKGAKMDGCVDRLGTLYSGRIYDSRGHAYRDARGKPIEWKKQTSEWLFDYLQEEDTVILPRQDGRIFLDVTVHVQWIKDSHPDAGLYQTVLDVYAWESSCREHLVALVDRYPDRFRHLHGVATATMGTAGRPLTANRRLQALVDYLAVKREERLANAAVGLEHEPATARRASVRKAPNKTALSRAVERSKRRNR